MASFVVRLSNRASEPTLKDSHRKRRTYYGGSTKALVTTIRPGLNGQWSINGWDGETPNAVTMVIVRNGLLSKMTKKLLEVHFLLKVYSLMDSIIVSLIS